MERREIEEAKAGDLIAISGMEDIFVGETITPTDAVEPLPVLRIDEPTLQMTFLANNSPFAGREGKHVTSRKVEERLLAELQTDVSLRVDPTDSPDKWTVSGRGELHLSILIETMRREGYELQVSRPEVIIKEIDGVKCEPFERVQIDTQKSTKVLLSKPFQNVKVICLICKWLVTVKHVLSSSYQLVDLLDSQLNSCL